MASASSSSARSLFSDSKRRLAERVQVNVQNAASVARQIVRGSRSTEVLMHSARGFVAQENAIENSLANLNKMQLVLAHLNYQHDSMARSSREILELEENIKALK
ncbi:uncharacterized protein LOC113383362 [Ctenocephalides felis]|uniref:uncharacterized protein LOC113383362 n=1 Tax=Ctenocephalides felis TaxID=7515 RepID=UPI000E6E23DE|nr:uncharacterized protein LOC113383362 [Ctenocephalides felis]